MGFLPGWNSPKTVETINSVFEYLETISLSVAIALELAGLRRSSNVAWVVLVISDVGRQVYGRREKALSKAIAEQATEEANLERVKLERRLEWGAIAALDRDRIRIALIQGPLSGKRVWLYSVNDGLSYRYGVSLRKLLQFASLSALPQILHLEAGFTPPGLHITGPDEESARFLAGVLSDNGIEVSSTNEVRPRTKGNEANVPQASRPDIEVHIGGRP